jgi:ABC-2 type transport system ATP-binding protein
MESPAIRVVGLVKRFGNIIALDGINLEIRRGECFGLLGPNGAGKTTTCDLLLGMTQPTAGTVEIMGMNWLQHARILRERVSVQFQEPSLYPMLTVEETIRIFRSLYRNGLSLDEAIGLFQLEDKRRTYVRDLSGGLRQRLSLACSFVSNPEIAFLDEPTAGLDAGTRRALWEALERYRAGGRTIVLTTHYLEEAQSLCDRVAIIDRGRVIASGPPPELVATWGGDYVIALKTIGTPGLSSDDFADLEGVTVQHVNESGALFAAPELHLALPAVLRRLAERQLPVLDLITRQPSLEDVFIRLTGRALDPKSD